MWGEGAYVRDGGTKATADGRLCVRRIGGLVWVVVVWGQCRCRLTETRGELLALADEDDAPLSEDDASLFLDRAERLVRDFLAFLPLVCALAMESRSAIWALSRGVAQR